MKERTFRILTILLLLSLVTLAAVGDTNVTNLVASGDITASDDLTVTDDASVGGNMSVTGTSTLTGNTTMSGNATVAGTLGVTGNTTFDGTITAENIVQTGAADAIQLKVTGYSTQTSKLFTVEKSDNADVFTISNDAEVFIDGQADGVELRVQGNATQTANPIFTVEQSTGTDVFTVDNNGSVAQTVNTAENVGMLPTWASAAITYTDSTDLFTVTGSETWVVHNVLINVTTNYDCTGNDCTLAIGPGTDTDGLLVLVDAEMQTADTEGTGWAAGWQGQLAATTGALLITNQDFVMDAADGIDLDIGGTDPAAGAATVWINYTRLD